MMIMTLGHLVHCGVAVVAIEGPKRSYRLTLFGVEVYEEVLTRSQSDTTLPANDFDRDRR